MNWSKIKKFLAKRWPPIFIFLVVVIFFWKFIFKGLLPIPSDTIVGMYHPWRDLLADQYPRGFPFKNFLITDPIRQQFPWRQLVIDAFKQGQLPLWNPYNLTGTPLLANFQSAPFYIFNILFFIFNFSIAWGILIFLQPLLAGLFMYFYLRELKLTPLACLFGALSFSFGGFFIAWLEWGTILHSALWLPLILLSIEKIIKLKTPPRCLKDYSLIWSFVFVFSLTQSFFAGHLQTFFYVFLFSLIYLFWKMFSLRREKLKVIFLYFIILYTFFFILTFFQWQPTLQLIKLSAREADQTDWHQPGWFIPWRHLVQFFAPDFFGNPTTLNYWGVWNYGELVGFIGVIPLLFAFWAIFFPETRYFILYTLYFILFLSLALPTPWAKLPYMLKLPFVSTAQPTRLMFLVDFCLAILAALGLNEFLGKKRKFRFLVVPVVLYSALWLFVLFAPKIWPQLEWVNNLAVSKRNLILPTGMLIAGVFLVWLMASVKKKFIFQTSLVCLFLLVIFDLFRFGWKFTPFVKKDWLFPSTKAIEFLQKDKNIFRLMSTDRRIMPPNFSTIYHLQTIDGYDPLFLRRYAELITASGRGEPNISPPFGFNRIITPHNYESRLMDFLNVKYVLALTDQNSPKLDLVFREGQTRVYENKNVFPRAFMVYDYRVARNKQEAIDLMMDEKIDLAKIAILEEKLIPKLVQDDGRHLVSNEVDIREYQENRVIIDVKTDKPGILILTDSYYPNWQAEIDEVRAKIYQANYHFRGLIVPEGKHLIEFTYSPWL